MAEDLTRIDLHVSPHDSKSPNISQLEELSRAEEDSIPHARSQTHTKALDQGKNGSQYLINLLETPKLGQKSRHKSSNTARSILEKYKIELDSGDTSTNPDDTFGIERMEKMYLEKHKPARDLVRKEDVKRTDMGKLLPDLSFESDWGKNDGDLMRNARNVKDEFAANGDKLARTGGDSGSSSNRSTGLRQNVFRSRGKGVNWEDLRSVMTGNKDNDNDRKKSASKEDAFEEKNNDTSVDSDDSDDENKLKYKQTRQHQPLRQNENKKSNENSANNSNENSKNNPMKNTNEEKTSENNNNNNSNNNNNNNPVSQYDHLPFAKRIFLDPQIPVMLSLYIQIFLNFLLGSAFVGFIFLVIWTIKNDIDNRINTELLEISQEISLCAREYQRNHCSPDTRVPALESSCMAWEKCMNRDPKLLSTAKLGAETFAEILNGFIKPMSWKSFFFMFFGVFGSLVMNNVILGSYKQVPDTIQYHRQEIIDENGQSIYENGQSMYEERTSPMKMIQHSPSRSIYKTPSSFKTPLGKLNSNFLARNVNLIHQSSPIKLRQPLFGDVSDVEEDRESIL